MRVTAQTKEETRRRIVDAARNLFQKKGFEKTTTRDLAATARIATGTLFNYFPTKEALAMELVGGAMESARAEFLEDSRDAASLEEALFAHVASELRHLRPHRGYVGDIVETAMSPFGRPGGAEGAERLRLDHVETVQALMESHGVATTVGLSAVVMHLYWTLYLGVLAFWAKDGSPNQEDSLVLLDQSLRLFVASLDRDGAKTEVSHGT